MTSGPPLQLRSFLPPSPGLHSRALWGTCSQRPHFTSGHPFSIRSAPEISGSFQTCPAQDKCERTLREQVPGQFPSRNDPLREHVPLRSYFGLEISQALVPSGSFQTCPAQDKFEMTPRSRTYKSCSTNARTAANEQEHENTPECKTGTLHNAAIARP